MTKIIAELCQNHNGDIKILEEMVHAASDAGAEYAKIIKCILSTKDLMKLIEEVNKVIKDLTKNAD